MGPQAKGHKLTPAHRAAREAEQRRILASNAREEEEEGGGGAHPQQLNRRNTGMRPLAASVCGLKLLVYAAFSYQCMRP